MDYSSEYNSDHPLVQELHATAGLLSSGVDEDGNIEWLGTKKQWEKYEELAADKIEELIKE